MKRYRLIPVMLFVLAASVLAGSAAVPAVAAQLRGTALLESLEEAFVEISEQVQKGVVSIQPTEAFRHPAMDGGGGEGLPPGHPRPYGGPPQSPYGDSEYDEEPGSGSGFILDQKGHVVTNAHVVGNATEMNVRLPDGRRYRATLVGKDTDTDLAVLRIARPEDDRDRLPQLSMGNSDTVRAGQWTIAVGHPFGLERSVTVGIVSGVGREGINLTRYENFIQTDAPINPGNSGGPLFNIHGEVIGITTAIMSYAQGIGFAIPVNMARNVVEQLIAKGHVERGWLGIGIQELGDDLAASFDVAPESGVLVNEVFPGQPAYETGLRPGDIIMNLNGHKVASPNTLARLIAGLGPEGVARLTFLRDGKAHRVDVTLARREPPAQPVSAPHAPAPPEHAVLGMDLQTLTPELAEELGEKGSGVLVAAVTPDGAAFAAGIRVGDVIREVNRQPVAALDALEQMLRTNPPGERLLIRLTRNGSGRYLVLSPGG